MSKLVESFLADAVNHARTPEVQSVIQQRVLSPLFSAVLDWLAPYLVAVGFLWGLMFLGIFTILVILLRSPPGLRV